ncbi:MAG: hypothetical protein IPO01_07625 [Chitinophagaceae bacterium]|nr:hypothetical protein [Chitinophagaceae bacterium]
MKLKLYVLAAVLFFCTTLKAQDNTIKFENIVNEQFGTLLESLLTNGKIDEANAKTYLETVFGYNRSVTGFLRTADLSQKIQSIGGGNLSTDSYVTKLNEGLLSLIPEDMKRKMLENPYYRGTLIGNELRSGYISEQSIEFITDIFQEIRDEKKRSQAIRAKFEELTPKLNTLKSPDGSFIATNKKKLEYHHFSENDWTIYKDIPKKQSSNAYNSLENSVSISGDALVLSNNIPRMHDHALFMFYTMRTFKNKERFDFSKDFQLDIYFDIPDKTRITGLGILIGKSFQVELVSTGGSNLKISTPSKYKITEQYGFLRSGDWPYNKINEKVTKDKLSTTDGHYKITIVKRGLTFTCLANGEDIKTGSDVTYFPDKYFLGFKQAGTDDITIRKVEMKHL